MGRRSGLLVSLLAHAAALPALILAKSSVTPPTGTQVIEASIVTVLADPHCSSLPAAP